MSKFKVSKASKFLSFFSLTLGLALIIILSFNTFILNNPNIDSFPFAQVYPPTPTPTPIYSWSRGYIYYNQTSTPWGGISLGSCTFASIGCGTTVTASVVSTKLNSTAYNPGYIYYTNYPSLTCTGFGVQDVKTILESKYNITTTQITAKNTTALKNEVTLDAKAGKKILLGLPIKTPSGTTINHITHIVGYDSVKKALIFNDPLYGASVTLETLGYTLDWSNALIYSID